MNSHPTYDMTDPPHMPASLLTTEGHQELGWDYSSTYPQLNEMNQDTDDFPLMYETELRSHGFNSEGAQYYVLVPTITKAHILLYLKNCTGVYQSPKV